LPVCANSEHRSASELESHPNAIQPNRRLA
jgi:hypothetical protein